MPAERCTIVWSSATAPKASLSSITSYRPSRQRSPATACEAFLHPDSPAEVYGLLGHHFAEADEPQRATEYLLKAANAARAAFAEDEAIELYRRALGFMEHERLADS
jgi:hypothetical protein